MTSVGHAMYAYALFASGIVAGVVTVVVLGRFRLYSRRVRVPFALLSLAGAVWATGYGFQLLSTTTQGQLFWARTAWVGAITLPTCWFVFSLVYAGEDGLLSREMVALLTVEPVVAIALVLTSDVHGLFATPTMLRAGVFSVIAPGVDPLLVGHVTYTTALAVVGVSVVGKTALSSTGVHRKQALLLGGTAAIPLVSAVSELFWRPMVPVDVTPIAFGAAEAIILWAVLRFRLFDVTPIARDAILSEIRDAVVVLDDHHRVIDSNGAAAAVLEDPPGACIGRSVYDVVSCPDDVRRVVDGADRVEAVVERDGTQRYFEIRAGTVEGAMRNRAALLVFHDVTDRRQTEEEFRALIENSRDVITVLDEDGTRMYTSPSMRDILGYEPETLVDERVFDIIHPDDEDTVRTRLQKAIASDSPVRAEYRIRHESGGWRRFETVGVNLLDDPSVGGIVLNSRDVTDRHRYEQRLRVLNRVLRHDLRNDMNVILGHAELLLDEDIPSQSAVHARTIERKASSLVELGEQTRQIDTTLDRSNDDLGTVDLVGVVEAELDTIEAEYPRAIVYRDLPDEQLVYADTLLESAITNLIDNALEHNDRVLPEVTVSIDVPSADADYVEVRIEDNGPGIPETEVAVLESGTETPLQHISGLGLWLVKWIADRSNGRLHFSENDPRGTVAVLELQRAEAERSTADVSPIESE